MSHSNSVALLVLELNSSGCCLGPFPFPHPLLQFYLQCPAFSDHRGAAWLPNTWRCHRVLPSWAPAGGELTCLGPPCLKQGLHSLGAQCMHIGGYIRPNSVPIPREPYSPLERTPICLHPLVPVSKPALYPCRNRLPPTYHPPLPNSIMNQLR